MMLLPTRVLFFFFNDTATTEIYTLSLHDALPISRIEQDGVDEQAPLPVVQDGDCEGVFECAVDCLANDVRGLVAVEGRAEYLDLEVELAPRHGFKLAAYGVINVADIAFQVGKRAVPVEVAQDGTDRAAQAVSIGVIAAVGRVGIGFQILGRDRRVDKDEIVYKVRPVQDLGGDRIEKSLRQLRLLVIEQEPNVKQLDLLPRGVIECCSIEFGLQAFHTFVHAVIVEADALADCLLAPLPVSLFEPRTGFPAGFPEQRVMLVESLNHRQCTPVGIAGVQTDGDFHLAPSLRSAMLSPRNAPLVILQATVFKYKNR